MGYFNILKRKLYHAQRYGMLSFASRVIPFVLVTEYPRSGGSWFCELLSTSLDMYFPRHSFQRFKPGIYHGHYLPAGYMKNMHKRFLIIRDGRDVMVSNYYKNLFQRGNGDFTRDVYFYRRLFGFHDLDDIRSNLPRFMEVMFTFKPPIYYRLTWEGNWVSFNEAWLREGIDEIIRYEDLHRDTHGVMCGIIGHHFDERFSDKKISESVEMNSFKAKTGRDPGSSDNHSHARKGIVGDYRNHFTRESAEIFNHHAGHLLIKLGYEKDDTWMNQF